MKFLPIDWSIIIFALLIGLIPTLYFGNRADKDTSDFLASRRAVTLWLDGRSIIVTTSHGDTSTRVTQRVRQHSVTAQSRQELA